MRPHPIPLSVFIPHRAASKPVARAHWILIHPGTVLCTLHGSLPSHPRPSLLCRLPCCPSHLGCRVALATRPLPSRLLLVLRGVVRVCFLFFLAVLSSAWFPPPCMHAQQQRVAICLGSVRCSRPVPPPSCGAALGGPQPCRATQPFSPRCCTSFCSLSTLPSPPLCLLPALLVLFSCSVCSQLVVSAPWLYLARPHAPQGLRPVFRPVGRPGKAPPDTPSGGLPRRPLPPAAPPSVR